jgi:ketosteroid isomerase-like protein
MPPRQLVEKFYQEFGAGNLDGVLALLDDRVVWSLQGPDVIPYFGTYKGRDGVKHFFERLLSVEDVHEFVPRKFVCEGDTVIVLGSERCSCKKTGLGFSVEWVQIFECLNDRITSWQEIIDTYPMATAYLGSPAAGA